MDQHGCCQEEICLAMPIAGNLIDRSHQIHRWLSDKYRTPYPTVLKWVPDLLTKHVPKGMDQRHYADTYLRNRKVWIRMSKRLCGHNYDLMAKILLHEYAHALDYRHYRMKEGDRIHPHSWGLFYSDLYDDYYHGTGWEESINF